MSTAKAIKEQIKVISTTLKQNASALSRAIKANNVRLLRQKIEAVESSIRDLNSTHTLWVSKAEFNEQQLSEQVYSNTWLEARWEEADDLIDAANILIQDDVQSTQPQPLNINQQLLIMGEKMKSLQLSISNKVDSLVLHTSESVIAPSSHKLYTEMILDANKLLSLTFKDLSTEILSLGGDRIAETVAAHELFKTKEEKRLLEVQINLAKHAPSSPTADPPRAAAATRVRSVEMEKCKAPSFSGKTIDYPEFKRGWQKVAAAAWDDDNQIEQLKFKVDAYTKQILSRCVNMEQVWEELDREFGQEEEVVNAVNSELKSLRSEVSTTPEFIIKLRNYLPSLELALSSVNGLEHLQTPDKVNMLVEKFDERTQHEWEYFKSKNTGKTYDKFFAFILDRYDSSRSIVARLQARTDGTIHPVNVNHATVEAVCFKCKSWTAKGAEHTCPACGHATSEGELIGHCLAHCDKYIAMNANQRSDCVKNANWCPVHLSATHNYDSCAQKADNRFVCGVNGCTKHHHRSLHGSTTTFVAAINALHAENANNVLMSLQSVRTASGNVNCFFDDGSNRCLILSSTAERLGLIGEDISMNLTTVIGEKSHDSKLYSVNIIDNNNEVHTIQAFGVPRLNNDIEDVNVDELKKLFSDKIQSEWDKVCARPSGEVELLVGSNYMGLHPVAIETIDNVRVHESMFGSGFVLVGSHDSIRPSNHHGARANANDIDVSIRATKITYKSVRDYLESNDLQVEAPRRCNNCMNCQDCSYRSHQMSLQEQFEYQTMENNVTYDDVEKVYRVKYPFTEDPCILTNNLGQVIKIAEREEKKLRAEGLTDEFNKEFDKIIEHGALVELSEEDISSWTGPVHYVSLQHVLKPESTTTPLRIVTNSSLADRNGNSLNSILMKGPNSLSDQRHVLSKWRCYDVGVSSDFTKAYYAMRTGELELHVRRVVWRYGTSGEKWRIFGFRTVSFGDKPAGAFLDIVINRAAKQFKHIDEQAADKISNDRYVDDLATGGTIHEVQRMVGENDAEGANKFATNGTLSQILSNGSLKLKAVVISGETDTDIINKLGRSVLGIAWDPSTDAISIDLRQDDLLHSLINSEIASVSLTKRRLLGIINKPHDPLGLISPVTIRMKVAYRDLFRLEPELGWDDEIPQTEKVKWLQLLRQFQEVSNVSFPRSTKPERAVGSPEVVGYFDGSDDAYAAVVYFRWQLEDSSVAVRLAGSKARVTPLKRISTPRSELNGAVLLSRLALSTIKACVESGTTPTKVWLLGDSECTLSSLEKTGGAFGEYFGNRVGEVLDNQARIQEYCEVGVKGEWYHVLSADNPADQPTRMSSTAADISDGSQWQRGPDYLYGPRESWPTNRDFADRKEECIPSSELLRRYRGLFQQVVVEVDYGIHNLIDPFSTNDWDTLIRRTQVLLNCVNSLQKIPIDDAVTLKQAEHLWFLYAMQETRDANDKGRLSSLCVEQRDGLIVVTGRAKSAVHKLLGKEFLPIVVGKSRVGFLLMLWAHKENHDARDITMSIACSKAWIVGAKRLATSITDKCVRCRFLHKIKVEQKMAALPTSIQLPSPPFSHVGVDLCGPLTVHSMTNKRATLKVWNVIFVCLNTKAVTMYLAPGYSTDDFMLAYNSHTSDHGLPSKVHSDKGSQLVAAEKELLNVDWDLIAKTSSASGTTWDFAPAGAQWRNGAVEIFVKKFKKSFSLLYAKTRLNFAEMSCAIKRIANVLNDRPLSVQKSCLAYPDADFLSPLTPNMMVTGRSGRRPPIDKDVNFDELPEDRLSFVEELERAWWYQYKVQYFTSLLPSQKWLHAKRNMCPGDIVLIEYKNKSFPGTYRLGRVKDVEIDPNDGLVRTCTVVYKLVKPSTENPRSVLKGVTSKEIQVAVQRLIIILPVEEQ